MNTKSHEIRDYYNAVEEYKCAQNMFDNADIDHIDIANDYLTAAMIKVSTARKNVIKSGHKLFQGVVVPQID